MPSPLTSPLPTPNLVILLHLRHASSLLLDPLPSPPRTSQLTSPFPNCLPSLRTQELQPELQQLGCGWEDFLWAVEVFHSRCFFDAGHLSGECCML